MWFTSRRTQANPAHAEHLLTKAVPQVKPSAAVSTRVWQKIDAHIGTASVFENVRKELTPTVSVRTNIWQRLSATLEGGVPSTVWDRLRDFVSPPSDNLANVVWQRIAQRLSPEPVTVATWAPALRWTMSVLAVVLLVRVSPMVFMARGSAHSDVIVTPKSGNVYVQIGGLGQPIHGPITLSSSALIQTDAAGEATVTMHDRAVLRLGNSTTVAIHDVSDARSGDLYDPTLTFYRGKLWVQGFLPEPFPALTVGTDQGMISMQEGSVSVVQPTEDSTVDIRVWNRRATVQRSTEDVSMFAGDQVALIDNVHASVSKLPDGRFDDEWMKKNLKLDAIHQREVAEIQRQRLAQQAGVLPTSSLYPIKRLAEEVDVFMTIGSQARTEKRLAQASTRLSEALALSQEGDSEGAAAPLQEFKDTVLSVASGTGDLITRALVNQQIASATSDLSAVLPDNQLYAVKEVIIETSAAISEQPAAPKVLEGQQLIDQLTSVKSGLEQAASTEEEIAAAREQYNVLEKRFRTLLSQPNTLNASEQTDAATTLSLIDGLLTSAEEALHPTQEVVPALQLNDVQVASATDRILRRIHVYRNPRSQFNQLILELQALRTHPDRGSILRELNHRLTSDDLKHFVGLEMERARLDAEKSAQNP